jgi:hypothetical protein
MEAKTITEALINGLINYKEALSDYSATQFNYKESEEIWSIAQMYEHLVLSGNYFFMKNIKYCLEQKNGEIGGQMNENGQKIFSYNSFPPIKVKVPGNQPQPVPQPKEAYAPAIDLLVAQLAQQMDSIENDAGQYKTQHPAFSWHNAKEWLQSFEMHHRHHLRQKAELEGYLAEKSIA